MIAGSPCQRRDECHFSPIREKQLSLCNFYLFGFVSSVLCLVTGQLIDLMAALTMKTKREDIRWKRYLVTSVFIAPVSRRSLLMHYLFWTFLFFKQLFLFIYPYILYDLFFRAKVFFISFWNLPFWFSLYIFSSFLFFFCPNFFQTTYHCST